MRRGNNYSSLLISNYIEDPRFEPIKNKQEYARKSPQIHAPVPYVVNVSNIF
jgi:hypothetical protein